MTGWPWPLDAVQRWFEDLWNWVSSKVWDAANWMGNKITEIYNWLTNQLSNLGSWLWNNIQGGISNLRNGVQGFINGAQGFLANAITGVSNWINSGIQTLWNWIRPFFDSISQWINNGINTLWNWIRSGWDTITQAISRAVNDASNYIVNRVNNFWSDMSSALAALGNWGNGILDWLKTAITDFLTAFWNQLVTGATQIGQFVWGGLTWLGTQFQNLFGGLINNFVKDIVTNITGALKQGSPPEDLYNASIEMFKQMAQVPQIDFDIKHGSMPPLEGILSAIVATTARVFAIKIGIESMAAAADHLHPIKEVGVWKIAAGALATMELPSIVSPLLSIPYQTGVLVPYQYWMNARYTPTIPDINTLIEISDKVPSAGNVFQANAQYHGLSADWSSQIWLAHYNIPSIGEAMDMVNRGIIDSPKFKEVLARNGMSPEFHAAYEQLRFPIPNVNDLVRMAVREALPLEGVATQFDALKIWGARISLSPTWIQAYWEAHWIWPSATQTFDMVQRGIIPIDEAKQLFILNDINPKYVDKIMQLTYTIVTRVDLRRLYQAGLIPADRLEKGYRDLGYNAEDAKALADFAKMQNVTVEKDLTKSEIVNAYRQGMLSEDEARADLENMGYDTEEIDIIVALGASQETSKERELTASTNSTLYRNGVIDEAQLRQRLLAAGYTTASVEQLVSLENMRKSGEQQQVTFGYLTQAYREGIIDEDYLIERLGKMNYAEEDIALIDTRESALVKKKAAA
jgi:hypothetical protein